MANIDIGCKTSDSVQVVFRVCVCVSAVFSGVSVNDGFNFEGVCEVSQDNFLCFRYIMAGSQSDRQTDGEHRKDERECFDFWCSLSLKYRHCSTYLLKHTQEQHHQRHVMKKWKTKWAHTATMAVTSAERRIHPKNSITYLTSFPYRSNILKGISDMHILTLLRNVGKRTRIMWLIISLWVRQRNVIMHERDIQ